MTAIAKIPASEAARLPVTPDGSPAVWNRFCGPDPQPFVLAETGPTAFTACGGTAPDELWQQGARWIFENMTPSELGEPYTIYSERKGGLSSPLDGA